MTGPLVHWRRRRRDRTEGRILLALLDAGRPLGGLEICRAAGLGSGTIYPTLSRMERTGRISSHWGEPRTPGGPRPRFYQITPEKET